MAAEKKLAGYICTGCGIGDRLDANQLKMVATREGKIANCKEHEMLCGGEGVAMVQADIDSGEATHIMIAACSRRSKVEAFTFQNVAMSRANLREGVIWARPEGDEHQETTQEMADDYVRMACAEVKFMTVPEGSGEQELNRTLLVVGGGMTGMTAALESARAGYAVHLVCDEPVLGGVWKDLYKRVPFRAAASDVVGNLDVDLPMPEDPGVDGMIEQVQAESRITVHLNAKITRTSGAPGRFSVDITTESGGTVTENIGAIVQATDYKPYDANKLPELAYGTTPDVVTNFELEKLAKEANGGTLKRPSDGKEVKSVAFIQCAGQRSTKEGHLSYCSGFCCTESIKQAIYFKQQNPGCDATVLFDDLRTPGAAGEDFYRSGQQSMVTFSKGKTSEVVKDGDQLKVKFKDLILNEDTEMVCDLVVLATGQVPNSGPDPYAQLAVEEAESEEEKEAARKALAVAPPSILNLDYRQGTDLPILKNGFVDSHFICFPYETRRTGIYAAGPVRRPMDMKQAMEDAVGAAMKAIQAAENAALGSAAHPRVGSGNGVSNGVRVSNGVSSNGVRSHIAQLAKLVSTSPVLSPVGFGSARASVRSRRHRAGIVSLSPGQARGTGAESPRGCQNQGVREIACRSRGDVDTGRIPRCRPASSFPVTVYSFLAGAEGAGERPVPGVSEALRFFARRGKGLLEDGFAQPEAGA